MGLRFRKSVTLCKGVKLNFGKTGMSVSVGGKGYHKTINTKGQYRAGTARINACGDSRLRGL